MLKTLFAKALYMCIAFLLITTSITVGPLAARSIHESWIPVREKEPASAMPEIRLNKKGALFVKKYIRNSRECLVKVKKRSPVPFSIIDSVLKRFHLPIELKYLAVIESELKPTALSHVGARGPWQLMPGTAQVLGLKTSHQNDERTSYYKSTIAAAKYLRDLYAEFNDWLLVLAAYNGGPKPVYGAIQKSGSKNFWVLQNYLPAESREHVKKFIATHYYFEGRGSETTLTKAENLEFRKMVKEFLKSNHDSGTNKKITPNPLFFDEKQFIFFDMNQLIGFRIEPKPNPSPNILNTTNELETSEQKFKRLMRQSQESLNRSKKII
ncbi:MAG TPA: lytic transglycosylase domain-containing protein [Puia sp.]|nr:lytic transglycosylase domain-containing protein [Puia sp.]